MKELRSQRGFTLIELLVVLTILALLAALIIPRMTGITDDARRKQTTVQIKQLEQALHLFELDNGFFPSTEQGLIALVTKPTTGKIPQRYRDGGYIQKVPKDPWDHVYIYIAPGAHGDFDLISYGADGEKGGEGKNADIENWNLQ
ncbi:MAG TPA: type II secretion system major pseudopilin GspG [Nitrospiria bacterium]|nr:type II secretion system major pseudopilin GspG [Nitrospiria bacterium]